MTVTRRLSFLLFLLPVLCIGLSAQRSRLHVVPKHYRTIQSAVDAARVGDTVLVDHGTYYENVRIAKNIVVGSRYLVDGDLGHRTLTIIDGGRARDKRRGSTIIIEGGTDTTCAVVGLTIQGGTGSVIHVRGEPGFEYWIDGGGIHLEQAGARIAQNVITRNSVSSVGHVTNTGGGGIGTADTTMGRNIPPLVIIEHNLVSDNTASGDWTEVSGISVVQPGIVRNNIVTGNRTIARGRAPGGGIGVFLTAPYEIRVERNYIRSNIAGFGGGILVGSSGTLRGRAVIVNNIIAENHAYELGGGVHVADASALLVNNTIVWNTAGSHRDGVNAGSASITTMFNNIVWNKRMGDGWLWTSIRLINNLSNEDPPGIHSLRADPLFIPGDTLFRLSPESPAIGIGAAGIAIGGEMVTAPHDDFLGRNRVHEADAQFDLGAMDSREVPGPQALETLQRWDGERSSRAKVTWFLRQTSDPAYDADSQQIVHAGIIATSIVVNDSIRYNLEDPSSTATITLPPGENRLEVEVVARGRKESRRLYAVLRLEGLDEPGLIVHANRDYGYKRYVNIPPGTYILSGYAGDETGFIDRRNRRTIRIFVSPYWYQRWWAYALSVLLIGTGVAYPLSLRVNHLRRERRLHQDFTQKQMEYQEAERKRLASELHDGLGQNLLIANNELQPYLQQEAGAPDGVRRASLLIQESIQSVREMSSNLHPHQLERLGFCAAVRSLTEQISHANHLAVSCSCDDVDQRLPREAILQAYRIIQEALANIVHHASATQAIVQVRNTSAGIEVSVTDDGRGFVADDDRSHPMSRTSDERFRGFGLASMAQRAKIVGGRLKVDSSPGEGTTISLTIPHS